MPDRPPREDWGQGFRMAVSKGRGFAAVTMVPSMAMMVWTEGLPQWFGLAAGMVALGALFPKSPILPLLIQYLPKLPKQGE